MKDFVENLERELASAADAERRRGPVGRVTRSVATDGRHIAGLGLVAVSAAAVGLVVAQAGGGPSRAEAFAVLNRPSIDARSVQARSSTLRNVRTNFGRARTFASAHGTGYVTLSPNGRRVCVSIPDIDGYGTGCKPVTDARANGMGQSLSAPAGTSQISQFVGVVPEGVRTVEISERRGPYASRPVAGGVLVLRIRADTSIRWTTTAGAVQTFRVTAHEAAGTNYIGCKSGKRPAIKGLTPGQVCQAPR